MAPKQSSKGATNGTTGGRIKFRFVDIEMDNVNESVTEGLKSLASALSARSPQTVVIRSTAKALQSGTFPEVEEIEDDTTIDSEIDRAPDLDEEVVRSNTPSTPKVRKLRAPEFLRELDLTKGSTSLEDFVKEKDPSSISDKYLVLAQWFKEYLDTPEITVDHIYTAFDTLGWRAQVPQDAGQPLRAHKKDNLMDSGSERGTYKINWNGTKAIASMGTKD